MIMNIARIVFLSVLFAISIVEHVEPIEPFHFAHRRQHAHVAR